MTTEEQITESINTLRERPHVVEFAKGCAERAEGYAADAADAADYAYAAAAAAHAAYAARHAKSAAYAANSAAYAARYAADYFKEREAQLSHLKELHASEESSKKD